MNQLPLFDDWRLPVSAAIGLCIAAGPFLAYEEIRWMRRRGTLTRDRRREMWLSLSPLPLNIIVTLAMAGLWAAIYTQAHAFAAWQIPVNAPSVLCALLAVDLGYYWEHRCAHRLRWLWGLYHAIHHSSADYTIATAYRVSFINQVLSPAFYLPLILLGFSPLLVVALQLLAFHYQAWLHTEMIGSMGWLDRWFNTPAAHRVHHSTALEHQDRNLGAITLIWDRCFGTFAIAHKPVEYGIRHVAPPRTAWRMYTDPWSRWLAGRRDDPAS